MKRRLAFGNAQLGPQRDLAQQSPRPRLVASLLVCLSDLESPARRLEGVGGAAGEQIGVAHGRQDARVPAPEPHPLGLLDRALQEGDRVGDAP